jgi:hypothetical protein
MSFGVTSSALQEQQQLKLLYAKMGGKCQGICAEGHRILGRNALRHELKDYCRKCVEAGFIKLDVPARPDPWVYFIADGHGHIKIGYATNVRTRFDDLQVANASALTIMLTIPGGNKLESELHKRFADHRVRGEWFRLVPEIIDFIAGEVAAKEPKTVPKHIRIQRELIKESAAS